MSTRTVLTTAVNKLGRILGSSFWFGINVIGACLWIGSTLMAVCIAAIFDRILPKLEE
jgi:hypothetical protein